MVEWSIAAVLKTVECKSSGGSNPSLRAKDTGGDFFTACIFLHQKNTQKRVFFAVFGTIFACICPHLLVFAPILLARLVSKIVKYLKK